MIDASQPTNHEDHTIALQLAGRPRLIVRNKIDLVARVAARAGGDCTASEGRVDISALTGEGLDALKDRLLRFAGMAGAPEKEDYLPNQRQKDLLQKALDVLTTAADPAGGGAGLELIAVDLKDGERYCNQLLGIDVEQDVLDTIFSRFCIGK
jgi:tRNA modification GTPase